MLCRGGGQVVSVLAFRRSKFESLLKPTVSSLKIYACKGRKINKKRPGLTKVFLKKVTICKESLYAENFEFDSSVNPVQRTTDCKMFRGRKKETIVH